MKFIAFLKDGLRETIDRKSFFILGGISVLFVLTCWSISFQPLATQDALQDVVNGFRMVMGNSDKGQLVFRHFPFEPTVSDVKDQTEGEFADGFSFTLKVGSVDEFYRAVWLSEGLKSGAIKDVMDKLPGEESADKKIKVPELKSQVRFLQDKFREATITKIRIERNDEGVFSILCRPFRRQMLRGGYQMKICFGAFSIPLSDMSVSNVVWLIEYVLAEYVAGIGGLMIALIFTASFIPSMLEKGHVEVLLSRPVSRVALLLYKYSGGLLYVTLLSVVLVGGSWLALAVRSGYWNPAYLGSIGVLTFEFAILYSIATLFAVLWRSWIGSLVMTIIGWVGSYMINKAYAGLHSPMILPKIPPFWLKLLEWVYYLSPKVTHLGEMNGIMLQRSNLEGEGDQLSAALGNNLPGVTWQLLIVSSVVFIVVMLGLACWRFSRKDY